jgi:hypothetical protein
VIDEYDPTLGKDPSPESESTGVLNLNERERMRI